MIGHDEIKHKYTHVRYFCSAMYALNEVLLLAKKTVIMESLYYSLLIDSSIDISAEDHLLIYIRYLDVFSFEFHTQYLCAVKIASATADNMFNVAVLVLDTLGLDKNDCWV